MTDNQFKVGDVVFLKSGSPPMTVSELHIDNKVSVTWMTPKGEIKGGVFSAAELEIED